MKGLSTIFIENLRFNGEAEEIENWTQQEADRRGARHKVETRRVRERFLDRESNFGRLVTGIEARITGNKYYITDGECSPIAGKLLGSIKGLVFQFSATV